MAKFKLTFDEDKCKGCFLCVDVCPKKILELDTERVNSTGYNPIICTNEDDCIGCVMCAIICPDSVIKLEGEE